MRCAFVLFPLGLVQQAHGFTSGPLCAHRNARIASARQGTLYMKQFPGEEPTWASFDEETKARTRQDATTPTTPRRAVLLNAAAAVVAAIATSHPAQAETSLISAKASYFRLTPRIVAGMSWMATDIKQAVEKGDWDTLAAAFEQTTVSQANSRRPDSVKPKSNRMQRDLLEPMSIWSSSFASKAGGPKSRAMLKERDNFELAMEKLQGVAELDKAGGGGFFGGSKKYDLKGKNRGQVAKEAYAEGVTALQNYIDIANDGLTRELRKLDTPFKK